MSTKLLYVSIKIAPDRFIHEIQKEFNNGFPFLKLEFFSKRAITHSDYSASQRIPSSRKIGDIQLKMLEGIMRIEGDMKVIDVERRLKDEFGLAAQVFRKSGNLWLETTMSDNWTLNQQNNHGREISTTVEIKPGLEDHNQNQDLD